MKRSSRFSLAAAAIAMAAAAAHAQTQVYNFETLYDTNNVPDPSGTYPDDFHENAGGGTVTQSTIGLTGGDENSIQVTQVAGATFTGAQTNLIPEVINDPNTVAISADVTIPSSGAFSGAGFAHMGISEFGNNPTYGENQVQTDLNEEVNIDLPAGTYHLTIPLIAMANPITFDLNVPFSNCFGSDPSTQLMATSFEFYFNKSNTSPLLAYVDNVTAIGPSVNATWASPAGSSWATTGNWNGGVPQFALDTANLAGAIGANSTITLDGNRSVEALNISDSSHQYTIAPGSGGTLTLDAGGSNTSTITDSAGTHFITAPVDFNTNTIITVNNTGDMLSLSGPVSGIGSLTIAGNGTVGISGAATYIGGTTINSGTLLVGSAQSLPTSNSVVNIHAGAKLKFATGIGGVTLQLPNITPGGTLDINNDHLFINYAGAADPISTVVADLVSGYNGGHWNGAGIISSAAAVTPGYALGYADSADPGNPASLSSGTIEVKYTLLGDANLDGVVNGIDFGILAANFNKGVTGWDLGDFNYDNVVNGIDFGDLAANFNKGASGATVGPGPLSEPALVAFAEANGLMADVPEPASTLMVMTALAAGLARRRPRRA